MKQSELEAGESEARVLTEYIQAAMRRAKFNLLGDGEGFFGEIAECPGVWADADTLEKCREELQEVLEAWILVRVRSQLALPIIDGLDLNPKPAEPQEAA